MEITRHQADAVIITESHSVPQSSKDLMCIEGYYLAAEAIRESDKEHGGVTIWLKTHLISIPVPFTGPPVTNMEAVAVSVLPATTSSALPFNVAAFYVSPAKSHDEARRDGALLGTWMEKMAWEKEIHVFAGDANARHPLWCPGAAAGKACAAKVRGSALEFVIRSTQLKPLNVGATMVQSSTAPDIFFFRPPMSIYGNPVAVSSCDHRPILLEVSLAGFIYRKALLRTPSVKWEQVNWKEVNSTIERSTTRVERSSHPGTAWGHFQRAVECAIAPLRATGRTRRPEKVPEKIRSKMQAVQQMCAQLNGAVDPTLPQQVSVAIASLNSDIEEWRRSSLDKIAHTLGHAPFRKNFGKEVWSFATRQERVRPPAVRDLNNKLASNSKAGVMFAHEWAKKHSNTTARAVPESRICNSDNLRWLRDEPVTHGELRIAIEDLNEDQCSDTAGLKPVFFLSLSQTNLRRLAHVVSLMLANGWTPSEMRVSHGVPLPKKGKDPIETSSYRPLSITLLCSRIVEIVVVRRTMDHLSRHKIELHALQFGFLKGKSVALALLTLFGNLSAEVKKKVDLHNQRAVVIAYDMTDAYCKVTMQEIEERFSEWNVPAIITQWIRSFLTNRTLRVFVGGKFSKPVQLSAGVPQGSIIGPFLWLVVMEKLLCRLDAQIKQVFRTSKFVAYADDLTIYSCSGYPAAALTAARGLARVTEEWAQETGMVISSKTEALMCSTGRSLKKKGVRPDFVTAGKGEWDVEPAALVVSKDLVIPFKKQIKILGVEMDHHVSATPYAERIATECERRMAELKREVFSLPPHLRALIVDGYIGSKIRHLLPVWWDLLSAEAKERLSSVWRQMATLITGAHATANTSLVLPEAGLRPLNTMAVLAGIRLSTKLWLLPQSMQAIKQQVDNNNLLKGQPTNTTFQPAAKHTYVSSIGEVTAAAAATTWHVTPDPEIGDPSKASHRHAIEAYLTESKVFFENLVYPPKFKKQKGKENAPNQSAAMTGKKKKFNDDQLKNVSKCNFLIYPDASIGRIKDPEEVEKLKGDTKAINALEWHEASGGAFVVVRKELDGSETEIGKGSVSLGKTACSFSMERETILEALKYFLAHVEEWIQPGEKVDLAVVTDSLSTLSQLFANGPYGQTDGQAEAIWEALVSIHSKYGIHTSMVFIYAHAGTKWNEEADKRAKQALAHTTTRPLWVEDVARKLSQAAKERSDKFDFCHPLRNEYKIVGITSQKRMRELYWRPLEYVRMNQLRTGASAELGGHLHNTVDKCYHCYQMVLSRNGAAIKHMFQCPGARDIRESFPTYHRWKELVALQENMSQADRNKMTMKEAKDEQQKIDQCEFSPKLLWTNPEIALAYATKFLTTQKAGRDPGDIPPPVDPGYGITMYVDPTPVLTPAVGRRRTLYQQ